MQIENMNDEQEMGGPMVGIDSKERKIIQRNSQAILLPK